MPNSPAKNINSRASHTMTPTLTMFGRFSVWILVLIAEGPGGLVAVVTDGLWTAADDHAPAGSPNQGRVGIMCAIGAGQRCKTRFDTLSKFPPAPGRGGSRPCAPSGSRHVVAGRRRTGH